MRVKNSKGRTVGIWLKKKKRPNTCRSFTSTYCVVGEYWTVKLIQKQVLFVWKVRKLSER